LSVCFGQAILSAQATGLWAAETSLFAGVNELALSPWRAMDAQNASFRLTIAVLLQWTESGRSNLSSRLNTFRVEQ
jgi:hypothetical protein